MLPIKEYIKHPEIAGYRLLQEYLTWLPDKLYIMLMFRLKIGYWLDLKNPRTFNEKIQWLKLYNRRQEYTKMVDKYAVKDYIASIIGEQYVIPTLGVWERPEDIEWDKLPNQFVLKITYGGGTNGVVICKDKNNFEKEIAIEKLMRSSKQSIYRTLKEWPYKDIKPRIIAEQYLEDENGQLKDYKFFCFNGKVRVFKIDFDRYSDHHANYYDTNGRLLPFGEKRFMPIPSKELSIPKELPNMIILAEKLSRDIPFLRVDFYNLNNKIYFGELTFFPASGLGEIEPKEWDYKLGEWLTLPFRH